MIYFSGLRRDCQDALEQIHDVWTLPMSEEELRFRFSRWQRDCRERKDAWQTSMATPTVPITPPSRSYRGDL